MSLDSAPEYALSFSGESVHLQRRDRVTEPEARKPAFRHMGSVDFDEPDFAEMLTQLRSMATGADASETLPVTVIIPDDQILYTTLTLASAGDRVHAVRKALDGLTPYAIEDLAFDWQGEGDTVRVAAVARQTLNEARDFAGQYGFVTQGYCAQPELDQFPGEPVFELPETGRARPAVNPVGAGVTAAALMFEDDEPETAPVAPVEQPKPAPEPASAPQSDAPHVEVPASLVVPAASQTASTEPRPTPEVRHAPPRPGLVEAANAVEPVPLEKRLPPRARAVHKRAAEARQSRVPGVAAPVAPPKAKPERRRSLKTLLVMLCGLIAGLLVIWSLMRSDETPAHVVAKPEPAEASAAPIASQPTAAATPETAAPKPTPEPAPAPDPVPMQAARSAAETVEIVEPIPVEPAARSIGELAPVEAQSLLAAATKVAAVVVPPAKPEPAAAVEKTEPAPEPAAVVEKAKPAREPAAPVAKAKPAPAPQPAPAVTAERPQPAPVASAPEVRLNSSARPQVSPLRSAPQTSVPDEDAAPRVPGNPMSYSDSQNPALKVDNRRPPRKHSHDDSGASRKAPKPAESANAAGAMKARPPQRPEGSVPELAASGDDVLDADDQRQLRELILDLRRHGLVEARAVPTGYGPRFADARPVRKPGQSVSAAAVDAALKSAAGSPPDKPKAKRNAGAVSPDSSRPVARPSAAASTSGISDKAVENAIKAAVDASPAIPNATRLSSSPLPPRRSNPPAAAATPDAAAPAVAAVAPPVAAGPSEAEVTARRALDEQLQAQAEARIRARAKADQAAELQARAQAEARARAQAEAEERAARARKQVYKPQEIDDEPELTAKMPKGGTTAARVASNATERRAMDTGRTTIIGIIGAGNASRALIRLRSGKVVTVRLGDKIDGGTINSIGNGRLTYVKAGRTRELRLLDGR